MNSETKDVEKSKSKRKPLRQRVASPFANNLKSVMAERGINLKSAADLAGVSPPVVHAWLQGGAPADFLAVAKLAKALGTDFQWLLTGGHAEANAARLPLNEIFNIQNEPAFNGIFMIEAKRLQRKED
ncbi:helix-turn-helix transcriptional regulator [Bdellovibrionota bacterium FG-2]